MALTCGRLHATAAQAVRPTDMALHLVSVLLILQVRMVSSLAALAISQLDRGLGAPGSLAPHVELFSAILLSIRSYVLLSCSPSHEAGSTYHKRATCHSRKACVKAGSIVSGVIPAAAIVLPFSPASNPCSSENTQQVSCASNECSVPTGN